MFTGLIEDLGQITEVRHSADGVVLAVTTKLAGEIKTGDSVATNGVCLTAISVAEGGFVTEVMNETLALSSLAEVVAGTPVNLELAMRPTDRLGGHIVQGHVDGLGTVTHVVEDGFSRRVTIAVPPDVLKYVVYKGSITVDGISLTVAAITDESFTVSLIPETLERTNLGRTRVGVPVNIEVDVLAKYVEKLTATARS